MPGCLRLSIRFPILSVSPEYISCIYLILYISQHILVESVCEDDIALCLELVKVINYFAAEEFAAVFECWLIDNDWQICDKKSTASGTPCR